MMPEAEALRWLMSMPFASYREMSDVFRVAETTVKSRVAALAGNHLIRSVSHSYYSLRPTHRWVPTAAGINAFAHREGRHPGEVLYAHPVSEEWQRVLTRRMDTLHAVYGLASQVARIRDEAPDEIVLYRRGPLDAAIGLRNGCWLGVVVRHHDYGPAQFSERMGFLARSALRLTALIVLVPRVVELRNSSKTVIQRIPAAPALMGPTKRIHDPDVPVWSFANDPGRRYTLNEIVPTWETRGERPSYGRRVRVFTMPTDTLPKRPLPSTSELKMLELLSNWPLSVRRIIGEISNMSERRVGTVLADVQRFGYVTQRHLGGQPPQRFVLSDAGIGYIGSRARVSRVRARGLWSPAIADDGLFQGGELRKLAREIGHTDMAYAVAGIFCRVTDEMQETAVDPPRLHQLRPAHKSPRYFTVPGLSGTFSITPDMTLILTAGERYHALLVEVERRASRPSTMAARMEPYLRYYAGKTPEEDFAVLPKVLFVLPDAGHEARFALSQDAAALAQIPLYITNMDILHEKGPYGEIWLRPGDRNMRRVTFWRYSWSGL